MDEDIIKAQKIVSGNLINLNDKTFHNDSFIYKTSNERISELIKYIKGRKTILTPTSSGDLVLNGALLGINNIDSFDISTFPKYFLNFKIAAVKALSKEEYVEFFFEAITTSEKYDEYYYRIRKYLDDKDLLFWDGLFDFFDWIDIYNSLLFSHETFYTNNVIHENMYLQGNNYNELRKVIDKVNINNYQGDIISLSKELEREYDLIYLSNILYYVDINKYLEMLKRLKLTNQGIILSYLYNGTTDKRIGEFQQFNNSEAGVAIYHK